jgi:hypothetical protein
LDADTVHVANLSADRVRATDADLGGDLRAQKIRANDVDAGAVVSESVRTVHSHSVAATADTLDVGDLRVHQMTADNGEFIHAYTEHLTGNRVDVKSVDADRVDAVSLSVGGVCRTDRLETREAALGTGEIRDLQVTGTARLARMEAVGAVVDDLETITVTTVGLMTESVDTGSMNAREARVDTLSVGNAELVAAVVEDLGARSVRAHAIDAVDIVGSSIKGDMISGRVAVFERADVGALGITGFLEAAGVDCAGKVMASSCDISGRAHAGELVTETATIRSAELSAARVGTLVLGEGVVEGTLRSEHVDTASITSQTARVRLLRAAAAELQSLHAEGITLGKGVLDASGGETLLGAVTATSVQSDTVHALRVAADALEARDVRSESVVVSGPVAAGSVEVAGEMRALTMTGEQAHIQDLHVADRSVFGGEVRFAADLLRLPRVVECAGELAAAGTISAPEAFIQSAFVTRINIGRA